MIAAIINAAWHYALLRVHYDDVMMAPMASQITSLTVVYSIVYSDADQRKHQSSVSLAFVWGIHRGPVNSPHKWPVTRKMFPSDDVNMHEYNIIRVTMPLSVAVECVCREYVFGHQMANLHICVRGKRVSHGNIYFCIWSNAYNYLILLN